MSTKSSRQFPNPLYWIEFWAVRWQEIQPKKLPELCQKGIERSSMMPASIIQNQNNLPISSLSIHDHLDESPKVFGIEFLYLERHKATINRPDCAEKGNTFSCRCMQHYWILFFWRYPHRTAGTMLLKMTFILKPQVHIRTTSQNLEFFYIVSAPRGRPSQSTVWACDVETQAGETTVCIVVLQESHRIAYPNENLTAFRPTGFASIQDPVAMSADLFRYRAELLYQLRRVFLVVPLQKGPQILFARIDESNIAPCEDSVQTARQFHSCFSRNMTGEYHATDDHNENLQIEESLAALRFA